MGALWVDACHCQDETHEKRPQASGQNVHTTYPHREKPDNTSDNLKTRVDTRSLQRHLQPNPAIAQLLQKLFLPMYPDCKLQMLQNASLLVMQPDCDADGDDDDGDDGDDDDDDCDRDCHDERGDEGAGAGKHDSVCFTHRSTSLSF